MHEIWLIDDLIKKIESAARGCNSNKVVGVKVKLGALSHISIDHFRMHFKDRSHGTIAQGARLHIEVSGDIHDPRAQGVYLESVQVEENDG
ncbi:MAG: hydrogenase maturation nickel metallochaperone HypA [Deltaproteobacteria bacterium]|nr:hydrogenase maturation nickel metallochaperone HypA [Deltaproteobacteria bacterium]MBW1961670.1 hydrogenase maturation nickel metallochaperone HypA [Deltaproteobacteria bacterium]MBW1994052.1 hydrogenase maturation nickel metallochaperone HypA [Deltaproteobacteria bacterium]MBW2153462.1 hydrogenase maturation nickel metallochaperone HypA [Deltaproteobacteria bacterium]